MRHRLHWCLAGASGRCPQTSAVWPVGLQAVQTLVQRWVVGSAGARTMSGAAAAYGSEGSSFRFTTSGNPIGGFTNCIGGLDGLVAGQRVFQAHRLHLFQRLHQAGWPHARVSSLYGAATALLAAALLLGGWPWVVGLPKLMTDPQPTPHRWLILGAGGHGCSVADAIRANGEAVLCFLDDGLAAAELVAGAPVLGPLALALGNLSLRQTWQQVLERQAAPVGVLVHPRACVSPSAQLAPGCTAACCSTAAPIASSA